MRIGFGKRVTPRHFDYLPRFYDPAKEELEARIAHYKENEDENVSSEQARDRIKAGLRQRYNGDANFRFQETKKSNLRLVYIIVILCFITYLVLRSDKIAQLLESLS